MNRQTRLPLILLILLAMTASRSLPVATAQVAETDPRQDGTVSVISLPFEARRVQFDQAANVALVIGAGTGQSRFATYDVSTLNALGQVDLPGMFTAVIPVDEYFLLVDGTKRQIKVVDKTLKVIGERQFTGSVDAPVIGMAILQIGQQQYSVPTLDPLPGAVTQPSTMARVNSKLVMDSFVIDEERKRPVWFAGSPIVGGRQARFVSSQTTPKVTTGLRLAPMAIRAELNATNERPWDLQLAAPYAIPFEKSQTSDGNVRAVDWIRLQAVPPSTRSESPTEKDVLLGRIRVSLPPDIVRIQSVSMTATRHRCLAAIGRHLFLFKFHPERVASWGTVAEIDLSNAPILIPGDKVTPWELKMSGNRKIERVEIRDGPMTWDANSQQVLIDPQPVLSSIRDEAFEAVLFNQRQFSPLFTLEQALEKLNDPANPTLRMIQIATGRLPQEVLWSVPLDLNATCDDGSEVRLAGNLICEVDRNRLRRVFARRQEARIAALTAPPLDPNRRLKIVDPTPVSIPTSPGLEPAPLIPNWESLVLEPLCGVLAFGLITGLLLPLCCQIANRLFSKRDPVENPTVLKSLGIMLSIGLLCTGIDSLLVQLVKRAPTSSREDLVLLVIAFGALSLFARTGITLLGITFLGRIPALRTLLVWVLLVALSFGLLVFIGLLVVLFLLCMQQMGML